MDASRKIIHIDMDAFFASVEQRDHPEYRGRPLAVGGKSERGVVAAASYEARQYGIHSAMAMQKALKKYPQLIVARPRMEVYKAVSLQIRKIFFSYTDLVEPLSLDEAFLDVTTNKKSIPSATIIAQEIRQKIVEQTGLTASAGVSINKFLAKVATDIHKPNGFTLIAPDQADAFVQSLPIEKFFGVGRVTAAKMHQMGIETGADLLQWSLEDLSRAFGKAGRSYYAIVRNEDSRPVNPHRERHSVGTEDTFSEDLHDKEEMLERLAAIAQEVAQRMARSGFIGLTLTLKVKFGDFRQITRSRTEDQPIVQPSQMMAITRRLFAPVEIPPQGVRLLGITISNACEARELGWQQMALPMGE
uniref:DNA polymerase IV n=1 Tax=Magnetococcus massalia (strain MO-1) TaxID=451514 RepID=A0A1S7LIJ4_MAGMO|nr:DNA polymerase IV, devoid of proofreading, damage-inducible protein P [Candidatus Magnetococcus massalia]